MVSIRKLLACTAAATAAMGSVAFAEGLAPVVIAPIVVAPPQARPTLAGYVDLMLGYGWGWEINLEQGDPPWEDRWREVSFRGAGRAAHYLTPGFGIQFEAWTKLFVGHGMSFDNGQFVGEGDYWFTTGGLGTHFIIGAPGGFQGGLVATVGLDGGLWANVGADVAATFGNFRISGQGGFSFGVFGDAQVDVERDIYAEVGATFYPTPNLSIGANVGWDRFTENYGPGQDTFRGFNYGFRVEQKLGNSPFAIHAAYGGFRWNGFDDDETWNGMEHVVTVGVRLLLGGDTLQAVDALVPFADRNHIYGDPFAPR
jgi:hypothetical protein